jgi:uncharacterized membrane protein YgcG
MGLIGLPNDGARLAANAIEVSVGWLASTLVEGKIVRPTILTAGEGVEEQPTADWVQGIGGTDFLKALVWVRLDKGGEHKEGFPAVLVALDFVREDLIADGVLSDTDTEGDDIAGCCCCSGGGRSGGGRSGGGRSGGGRGNGTIEGGLVLGDQGSSCSLVIVNDEFQES